MCAWEHDPPKYGDGPSVYNRNDPATLSEYRLDLLKSMEMHVRRWDVLCGALFRQPFDVLGGSDFRSG